MPPNKQLVRHKQNTKQVGEDNISFGKNNNLFYEKSTGSLNIF